MIDATRIRSAELSSTSLTASAGEWTLTRRSLAARAPVVHGEGAVAELLRRDQLKPSRTG